MIKFFVFLLSFVLFLVMDCKDLQGIVYCTMVQCFVVLSLMVFGYEEKAYCILSSLQIVCATDADEIASANACRRKL